MEEEPSLPYLPMPAWRGGLTKATKRVRACSRPPLFSNSSDPAIFSSDDDPSLDNYTRDRRKRRYVGSWYHQQPAVAGASTDSLATATGDDAAAMSRKPRPRPRRKRTLQRDLDSGVWMASDATDSSEDVLELPLPTVARTPAFIRPLPVVSEAERVARQKGLSCLEEACEDIDLT